MLWRDEQLGSSWGHSAVARSAFNAASAAARLDRTDKERTRAGKLAATDAAAAVYNSVEFRRREARGLGPDLVAAIRAAGLADLDEDHVRRAVEAELRRIALPTAIS